MLSDKQLTANRANAQLSSGPKSEEGKRRSSLNARRHNLTGQLTAMPEEDRIAHDAFAEALIKAMAPEGALELQLAQRIATDSWRLNRSSAIEDNIFALGLFDHSSDIDVDHPELHSRADRRPHVYARSQKRRIPDALRAAHQSQPPEEPRLTPAAPGHPQSRAQSRTGESRPAQRKAAQAQ